MGNEAPSHLSDAAREAWAELVTDSESAASLALLEALACQVALAREAAARVHKDGILLLGDDVSLVPHPALAIERLAHREIATLTAKRVPLLGVA